jgi:hypothetical protein
VKCFAVKRSNEPLQLCIIHCFLQPGDLRSADASLHSGQLLTEGNELSQLLFQVASELPTYSELHWFLWAIGIIEWKSKDR